jgi:hypothetical protein
MPHELFGTPMSPTHRFGRRPVLMGDLFHFRIEMLPKSERLHKVKAHKEMLLLPAELIDPGSMEQYHGVIAMTMYRQVES